MIANFSIEARFIEEGIAVVWYDESVEECRSRHELARNRNTASSDLQQKTERNGDSLILL